MSWVFLSPIQAQAQDGDGDGVPNVRDICPRTRSGRSVDSAGCDAFCEVLYDPVGTSSFLRSRLIEVGATDWGSFGTPTPPPAGWHPRNPDNPNAFGFVANPADDGWVDFKGDFFVPGTPEEGFGVNVGGVDYFTSRLMGVRGIVGDFTGARTDCRPRICGLRGGASTYWSGSVAGIGVDQVYSVFNEGVFILVQVTMTNRTASTQTVYYMRNVDPDNMVSVTGSYVTTNTIVAQGDGTPTSLALVSATTSAPDSYIALGSSDPDARVTYGGFSNRDVDGIWNCVGLTCATGSVQTNDIGISIAFRKTLAPGAASTFSFVYALSPGSVAESVSCTTPAVCGDGLVEGTESCDDGNGRPGDGCDAACGVEAGWNCMGSPSVCTSICGDRLRVGAEVCDTGGASATCDADCTAVACGDRTLNGAAGEACDDGNVVGGDGCSTTCRLEICGNGFTDVLEECDTSGASATCDADCTAARCGDRTLNGAAGEACDDGGESRTCDVDCTPAACGDSTRNATAGEACDTGGASALCDADCTAAACGDGTLNAVAGELCDDANATAGDGCSPACRVEACGNAFVDAREACDDGGESLTCDADCSVAMCGDGTLNATAGEACDAGGASPICDADCTVATCGDGTVNATAGEVCDDGNTTAGDGCSSTCALESCGNRVVDAGEACDDGAETATCDVNCTAVSCGDGTVNVAAGELCDDAAETAACDADCTAVSCGDGVVNAASGEACDDGGTTGGDGCSATCRVEVDGGMPDAGMPDAGEPDAGPPDAGAPDAGEPDAGPRLFGVAGGAACSAHPGRGGDGALGVFALGLLALFVSRRRGA